MRTGSLHAAPRAALVAWFALAVGCTSQSSRQFAGFLDAPVAAVAAQVAGRVESVPVHEGDVVRRGQLLAQLDARESEAQLAQARANLEQAREAFGEAEAGLRAALPTVGGAAADVARAQATLDEAQQNFDRTQQLVGGSAGTQQQLDAARARLREARAALESLTASKAATRGKVSAAAAAVSSARAAVAVAGAVVRVAEVRVAQARVLSPFDGLVVSRDLEEGEWAAAGTPTVTVENHERLWVRLDVEETRLGDLRLGQAARVTVVAVPGRTFRGHVVEVGAQGDFAVNRDVKRGRPDIRTFRVRVGIDEPIPELRPGMTAEVTIAPAGPSGAPVATGR